MAALGRWLWGAEVRPLITSLATLHTSTTISYLPDLPVTVYRQKVLTDLWPTCYSSTGKNFSLTCGCPKWTQWVHLATHLNLPVTVLQVRGSHWPVAALDRWTQVCTGGTTSDWLSCDTARPQCPGLHSSTCRQNMYTLSQMVGTSC